MVWLTWRQHRAQVLIAAAFVVVVAGLLLWHRQYAASVAAGNLDRLGAQLSQVTRLLTWSIVPPALIGLFWGAPLLGRELERGTHRLAWTQSVTRRDWLGVKLAGLGAVVTVAGLAFGLIVNTWLGGFTDLRAARPFTNQDLFMVTGIVPAAWWLFGFALGVAAGAVTRKLLPAMAITLVVFFTGYIGMITTEARLHYATPERQVESLSAVAADPWSINTPPGAEARLPAGALLVDFGWFDRTGATVPAGVVTDCGYTSDNYLNCLRDKDIRWFADYQPADRYWQFQWTEAGLLAMATIALGAVAWSRVR